MMQFTEEQKKELLAEIDYNRKNCFLSSKTELLMKVAEAALKAKPVAWRWEKNNGLYFEGIKPIGVDSQPLYTAPPVAELRLPDMQQTYSLYCTPTTGSMNALAHLEGELLRLNATATEEKPQ